MSSGFGQLHSALRNARRGVEARAEKAVRAALEPVLEESQGLVPVDTGTLKGTGKLIVEVSGTKCVGTVSYGSADTVTEFNGIGYEVFVHTPGTVNYGGVPYLEQPTLDAEPNTLSKMAGQFKS